jgi:ribonucleotide reductase alpha subunit
MSESKAELPLQIGSMDTWETKYQLKTKEGVKIDLTVDDTYKRVAKALASVEEDTAHWEEQFLWALRHGAIPAGRILSNLGAEEHKPGVSAINCTVSDTIEDSIEGILEGVRDAGITLSAGCGIGYEFSTIRPNGAMVSGVGSTTTGAIPFMDIYDKMCFTIASAGGRRGAQMATFDLEHPDVLNVIKAKREDGKLRQFNISLLITDKFLEAVKSNAQWIFSFPVTRKTFDDTEEYIYRTFPGDLSNYVTDGSGNVACKIYGAMPALELWDIIMQSTYTFSEPGFLLVDKINKENPLYFCENIRATNPCFTGDTKVWTAEGQKTFKSLAESGEDIEVLTQTTEGKLVYRTMRNPRMTRKAQPLVRVTLDNGETVRCTPDHRFYLKDGSALEAQELKEGDRIESVYRYNANQKGYKRLTNGQHTPLEHHVPFENLLEGWEVHHDNEIKCDNRPSNLRAMPGIDHKRIHMTGDNNPTRRIPSCASRDVVGNKNPRYRHDIDTVVLQEKRDNGMSYIAIAKDMGLSKYAVMQRLGYERPSNHKVVSVETLTDIEDVYCGTVDETARFFLALGEDDGVLVSNCAEQPLPPNGACLLGSINLTKFVIDPFAVVARFDFKKFKQVVTVFTRMLDNVVDMNNLPLEAQRKEILRKRRHGMGYLGLGSAMTMLGMVYGSPESVELTEKITAALVVEGWRAGIALAKEKGAAPIFSERFKDADGELSPCTHLFIESVHIQRVLEVAPELELQFLDHGCRFTHHSSIAPTGTLALSVGNNASNGIEPSFAHSYMRNVIKSGKSTKQVFEVASYELLLYRALINPLAHPNSPDSLPDYFKGADEIDPKRHIDIQATAQYWIDSSISKTINVPTEMPYEDFKDIYSYAIEQGLKGCTTFRFNPEVFQGVLVKEEDLKNTQYTFVLETGEEVTVAGDATIDYAGDTHSAANLFDAIKEGYFGKF